VTDVVACVSVAHLAALGPVREIDLEPGPRPCTGDRLYVVAGFRLRGWLDVVGSGPGSVTVAHWHGAGLQCRIKRFSGLRYRWWSIAAEKPQPGACAVGSAVASSGA